MFYVQLYQEKGEKDMVKSTADVKDDFVILKINRDFFELFIKANGKADLYFHAYFWDNYFKTLQKQIKELDSAYLKDSGVENINILKNQEAFPFLKRIGGLAKTVEKVLVNIKKFPFTEEHYNKYVKEFAKKSDMKKQSALEQVQRALFVAQIADNKEALFLIEKLLVQLQGYCDITIRDTAVVLMNMLYDGIEWQL